jgi:hypothetical protein
VQKRKSRSYKVIYVKQAVFMLKDIIKHIKALSFIAIAAFKAKDRC